MENSNIANEKTPMLNKSFVTTNKTPLFVAGVLIFASFGAWAKCAIPTLLDSAPIGYCHNEYGQIETDQAVTNAILTGILKGGSKQKPKPVRRDNSYLPFIGKKTYHVKDTYESEKFNLQNQTIIIEIIDGKGAPTDKMNVYAKSENGNNVPIHEPLWSEHQDGALRKGCTKNLVVGRNSYCTKLSTNYFRFGAELIIDKMVKNAELVIFGYGNSDTPDDYTLILERD